MSFDSPTAVAESTRNRRARRRKAARAAGRPLFHGHHVGDDVAKLISRTLNRKGLKAREAVERGMRWQWRGLSHRERGEWRKRWERAAR